MDWEDQEKAEQQEFVYQPYPQLTFAFRDNKKCSCSTLYIALYGSSSLFAHSLLSSAQPINRLNFSKSKQQSLADLYLGTNNNLYLIFNDQVESMKEVHFAKFIVQTITFQQAVILTSVSKNTLNNPATPKLTFLATSRVQQQQIVPRFKQGVMGVAADILQWGELNHKPVSCFIGGMGDYELSSEIIEQVYGALRSKSAFANVGDISDRVRKYNMKKYSTKIYL